MGYGICDGCQGYGWYGYGLMVTMVRQGRRTGRDARNDGSGARMGDGAICLDDDRLVWVRYELSGAMMMGDDGARDEG